MNRFFVYLFLSMLPLAAPAQNWSTVQNIAANALSCTSETARAQAAEAMLVPKTTIFAINGQSGTLATNNNFTVSTLTQTGDVQAIAAEVMSTGTAYHAMSASVATTVSEAQSNQFALRSWVVGFSNAPATYNSTLQTIDVNFSDGTTGQMFEEMWEVIKNTAGAPISNGVVVRTSSASGELSGAKLASCTDTWDEAIGVIGLSTMTTPIPINGIGKITTQGNVNDLDTSMFEEGSNLWLSVTPGQLTMTKPTGDGHHQILIGQCLRKHANAGRIYVHVHTIPRPEDIDAVGTNDFRYTHSLTNASAFATSAQGIAATNAQARVDVVETNAATQAQLATVANTATQAQATATQALTQYVGSVVAATAGVAYASQLAGYVPTNDARYLSTLTNAAAFDSAGAAASASNGAIAVSASAITVATSGVAYVSQLLGYVQTNDTRYLSALTNAAAFDTNGAAASITLSSLGGCLPPSTNYLNLTSRFCGFETNEAAWSTSVAPDYNTMNSLGWTGTYMQAGTLMSVRTTPLNNSQRGMRIFNGTNSAGEMGFISSPVFTAGVGTIYFEIGVKNTSGFSAGFTVLVSTDNSNWVSVYSNIVSGTNILRPTIIQNLSQPTSVRIQRTTYDSNDGANQNSALFLDNITITYPRYVEIGGDGSSLTGITAVQVGAVPTNDTRYLATLTNGGPVAVAATNAVQRSGDTMSGSLYTTAPTALSGAAPAQSELVTAGWVRNLIGNSGQSFYNSSNVMVAAWSGTNYGYQASTQALVFSRTYTAPTNGEYIGFASTTNAQAYLGGSTIAVDVWLSRQGGSGGGIAASVSAEIYFAYDTNTVKAALMGDIETQAQAVTTGTNLYQWVVSIPPQAFTSNVYIIRAFRASGMGGTTRPNIVVVGGDGYPSRILVNGLSSGQGYVYEAPQNGTNYVRKNAQWVADNALTNAAAFDTNGAAASASNGAIAVSAAAITAATNTLASPYQPWTAILTPPASGGTTLVSFAHGTLPLLVCTGAQTIGVDSSGWQANGVNRFALGLFIGSQNVKILTNDNISYGNGAPPTLSTTKTNSLLYRSVGTNNWTVWGSL